jgi:mono/diheme cytochrome c family protein
MKAIPLLTALLTAALLCACRQDMNDQAKYGPLKKSDFYQDGASSRTPPAHTVARGELHQDAVFYTGRINDKEFTATLPVPLTPALLKRGEERFNIYCSVCHGRTGEGNGMIVQRGFPHPPSYAEERLRNAPVGYFYEVITHGYGLMYSYASRVEPQDRWAIAAYIRVLQLSLHATLAEATPAERSKLEGTP